MRSNRWATMLLLVAAAAALSGGTCGGSDSSSGIPLGSPGATGEVATTTVAVPPSSAEMVSPAPFSGEQVVVPNIFEDMDTSGVAANRFPFLVDGGLRYQQVYDASQFASFGGPRFITQIAFRPDNEFGGAFTINISDLELSLSTIAAGPDGLVSIFADNLGLDNTLVFDGPTTLSSNNDPGPGDTRAFDVVLDLMTPFLYDPALGNLLLDVRNAEPGANNINLFFDSVFEEMDSVSRAFGPEGSPGAAAGRQDTLGLITQFGHIGCEEPPCDGDGDLEEIVSFSVEAGFNNGTFGGELVRPVDAVDLATGDLVFSAFPDTILEDIDAFHLAPDGAVVFSTSTDVTQGFGGIPNIKNGDLVLWDGVTATLLFSEVIGFGGANNNIDAFSILPNGNWLLSTDLNAILGGLSFQNGDIVEYDPVADVATLYEGLDEATIFTGTPNSNPDIDALHATADGTVIFSIRSDGIGRVGNGPTYGFADAPRTDLFQIDPATLDASLFLDGDGLFDGVARNLDAVSLPGGAERTELFGEDFVQGQTAVSQCTVWNDFRASLEGSFTAVTISGTFDPAGITCTNAATVNSLANGLRDLTNFTATCDGHVWSLCARDQGELWIDPPFECSPSNCPNPGHILRPCISNLNWGGVGTPTCNAPSQTMELEFQ